MRQGTENTPRTPSGPRLRPKLGLGSSRVQLRLGEEAYLWLLVAAEVIAIGWLRAAFRNAHGG